MCRWRRRERRGVQRGVLGGMEGGGTHATPAHAQLRTTSEDTVAALFHTHTAARLADACACCALTRRIPRLDSRHSGVLLQDSASSCPAQQVGPALSPPSRPALAACLAGYEPRPQGASRARCCSAVRCLGGTEQRPQRARLSFQRLPRSLRGQNGRACRAARARWRVGHCLRAAAAPRAAGIPRPAPEELQSAVPLSARALWCSLADARAFSRCAQAPPAPPLHCSQPRACA